MFDKDSTKGTITVALVSCIVASVLVCWATVSLRPAQEANKAKDNKKNILQAAGIYQPGMDVEEAFKQVEPRMVDLATGAFVEVDTKGFDAKTAAKDPATSEAIPLSEDIAKIRTKAKQTVVYLIKKDGQVDSIILPIYGKGLWSTMYAYMALAGDGTTVKGLAFYEHGETPGLGGEVDNARWKALWPGKMIYDKASNLMINVIKGPVDPNNPDAKHMVDGLSGATLTTRGVNNLIRYWMSNEGYAPFLKHLKEQGA